MTTELTRLDKLVVEINTIKQNMVQTVVAGAIAVGQRLQEAKASVPFGEWGEWLKKNVDFSERKAEDWMRLAREYGGKDVIQLESLGLTKAVQLLALPAPEREAFIAENPVEDMSTRELKAALEAAQAEKEKMQLTIDELMAAPNVAAAELEAARAENEAMAQQKKQAADMVANLKSQNAALTQKAKEHEKDQARWKESRRTLQAELDGKEKELARVREELEKAGQPIIQQVTPPDVQRELEQLRAERDKAAKTSGNEIATAEFKAAFDNFKVAMNQMLAAMGRMTGEVKGRYRSAVEQTMQITRQRLDAVAEVGAE